MTTICSTFVRNFIAKNFQKSPNLVTLLPMYDRKFRFKGCNDMKIIYSIDFRYYRNLLSLDIKTVTNGVSE